MQIGDNELDEACDAAIAPAIEAAGFAPRRVDRHNAGDLLKSEIVQFIERSQIIVADVTNERPNCYLEIGYAMGLGKKANLILTAREDHHHGSPNYRRGGPKVHFDLEGYDILFWDPADLDAFREELTKRIVRRAAIVRSNLSEAAQPPTAATGWRDELRARGEEGVSAVGRSGYMEVVAQLRPRVESTQQRLLEAVREAEVHNFGWPIGITLDNRDEYRPRPTADGIMAEVAIGAAGEDGRASYDLWKLFRDARFYTLISLFEDEKAGKTIWWDTRIYRVTEAFLFLVRLYRRLGASDGDEVVINIRHAGLAGRELRVADQRRHTWPGRTAADDVVETSITASIIDLEANLVGYVKEVVQPLFVVFDFFEVSDEIIAQVVQEFLDHRR